MSAEPCNRTDRAEEHDEIDGKAWSRQIRGRQMLGYPVRLA